MNQSDQLATALTGRYEIEREIGAGGMATVFLARDVRHNRRVALKVLRPELGAVLGVDRFLAEIQVTANLQHPNLLPLFDSGEANGLLFYVMPFVDGESLRARLDREKQLPVDEAVRIAVAIAGALDYAHRQGVIHRDLKPENVLLQAGQPVIADFGIALAVSNAGGTRVTQTGLSLGTPQYMSPEQATGDRGIDGRTDIYSLAAMTYEMLTGEPPHMGTSAQAIIAKLMTEDVRPVSVLRRSVPAHVDAAVRHGLEKLAADRFATAGDFSLALTGARPYAEAPSSGAAAGARSAPRLDRRTRSLITALSVIAVGGSSTAAWLATRPQPVADISRFTVALPDSVRLSDGGGTKVAVTRDGRAIVMVGIRNGVRGLYLRRMDDPVAEFVRGSDVGLGIGTFNASPRFSADGEWIAFVSNERALKKVPVSGGAPQTLADSTGGSFDWGDGDRLVYVLGNELWVGSGNGRDGRPLARPDTARGIYRYLWPHILPDGERALVTLDRSPETLIVDSLRLGIISLEDGEVTDLGQYGTNPYYVASGHIVFGRSGGLVFAAPFSLEKGAITGTPRLIVEGVWQGTGGATGFAVADNGLLVHHGTGSRATFALVRVDRSGRERVVPGEATNAAAPRVSPDGGQIAYVVDGRGLARDQIALADVATGARQRLADDAGSFATAWDRSGRHLVYLRATGQVRELVSRSWDRPGEDRILIRDSTRGLTTISVGPSGGFSALRGSAQGNRDIFIAPTDSMVLRPFVATPANEVTPEVSPDGRWLAYESDESGIPEVYIQALPGPGPRVLVSINGGSEPVWVSTATLLYRTGTWLIEASLQGSPPQVVRRDSLFADSYRAIRNTRHWDAFPGGREFVFLKYVSGNVSGEVTLVLNWPQLLQTRER